MIGLLNWIGLASTGSICLLKGGYFERCGPLLDQPEEGGVVDGGWDFTAVDRLGPHPVYTWMGWASGRKLYRLMTIEPIRKRFLNQMSRHYVSLA